MNNLSLPNIGSAQAPVVVYGRVSTNQQSTEAQETRSRDYINFKWPVSPGGPKQVVAEFYDDDVSGSIPIWDRPQGRALRTRLQVGDAKHLVVAKLDRLGRSAIDLLQTVKLLDSLGVVLHIVDMGGDSLSTQGASGRLMFTVLAGMAEYERELIRGRIEARFEVKRDKGELCGTVPYGWNAVETGEVTPKGVKIRRLEDNPAEQRWILYMHQLRESGLGYHTIAKYLNGQGAPTKHGAGDVMRLPVKDSAGIPSETKLTRGKWQAGNVAKVLNNLTVRNWLQSQAKAKAA